MDTAAAAAAVGRARNRVFLATLHRRVPGLHMGHGARIDRTAKLVAKGPEDRITMGPGSFLRHGVYIATFGSFVELGEATSIGPYCVLYGQGGLTIGDFVSMGPHCVVVSGGHHFEEPGLIREQGLTKTPVTIGDGVWVGANVTVLEGATIGKDAIIAAGAVVRPGDEVPPGAVWGGVPGRLLSFRPGYEEHA
jgi:acetyltransferase-like isoleucine patch superfamily enzyme